MISQIYEKYMCYLNTNQECQAFRNYYDLREKIVSGWIHENAEEFAEIWEIVKYNEIHEFSSSIYMRHPNCDNPDLEGPYEIPNYVGRVLPSAELNYEDLKDFKPSRSSAQSYRNYVPSRSSAQWDYDDLEYFKPSRSSAQPYRAFELNRSSAELNYEDLENFKPSRSSAQPYRDSDDFKVTRSTAEPYDGTTKFHFDYDILQGGDNSYGCSYNSYGGLSVRETNQTNMTLSELDFKEEEDDEMPELMEM